MKKIAAIFFAAAAFTLSVSAIADTVYINNDNLSFTPVSWHMKGVFSKNPEDLILVNQTDKTLSVKVKLTLGYAGVTTLQNGPECSATLDSSQNVVDCNLVPNEWLEIFPGFISLGGTGTYQLGVVS